MDDVGGEEVAASGPANEDGVEMVIVVVVVVIESGGGNGGGGGGGGGGAGEFGDGRPAFDGGFELSELTELGHGGREWRI